MTRTKPLGLDQALLRMRRRANAYSWAAVIMIPLVLLVGLAIFVVSLGMAFGLLEMTGGYITFYGLLLPYFGFGTILQPALLDLLKRRAETAVRDYRELADSLGLNPWPHIFALGVPVDTRKVS